MNKWMELFYVLRGKEPMLLETPQAYAQEVASGGLQEQLALAIDFANPDHHVSTVFLGIDHSAFSPEDKTPVLFETMVFPSRKQRRAVTLDDALAMHDLQVKEEFGEARMHVEQALRRLDADAVTLPRDVLQKLVDVGVRAVEQGACADWEIDHELLVFMTSLGYERREVLPRREARERFPKAIAALTFAAHHFAVQGGKLTCAAFDDGDARYAWDAESGRWEKGS